MAEKNSFMLFDDMYEPIKHLSLEEKGELLDCIFQYRLGETEINPKNQTVFMAFQFIKQSLIRREKAYAEKCEKNKNNGQKGGRPPKKKDAKHIDVKHDKPEKPNGYIENPEKPNGKKITLKDTDTDKDKDLIKPPTPFEKFDAENIDLPDFVDRTLWIEHVRICREAKRVIGETLANTQIRKLTELNFQSKDVNRILKHSNENGYYGIIDPDEKGKKTAQPTGDNGINPDDYKDLVIVENNYAH